MSLYTGDPLLSGRYNMTAELYVQTQEQNESGQIRRTWDYQHPIVVRNRTNGILGGGIRVVGSTEDWNKEYQDIEWAKMIIGSQRAVYKRPNLPDENILINRRFRVGKIRDLRTKEPLWIGDDGLDIEFNIQGITPIHDPYQPAEYELLLKGVMRDGR